MADIDLLVAELKGANALPSTDLTLVGKSLSHYFAEASRLPDGPPAINLVGDPSDHGARQTFQQAVDAGVDSRVLHETLASLTNLPEVPQPDGVRKIGLILTTRYVHAPTMFGLMFDIGALGANASPEDQEIAGPDRYRAVPRTGCAVFLNAIRSAHENDDADFHYQSAYTAVHELGHVFNLWHLRQPKSFMFDRPPGFTGTIEERVFTPRQHEFLRGCEEEARRAFVVPGAQPFARRGDFVDPDSSEGAGDGARLEDVTSGDGGWRLRIAISQKAFYYFEPVELDVWLHAPQGAKSPRKVPNEIDAGFTRFDLWITRPDGERRRYRSPMHYCPPGDTIAIPPKKPFHRDISVFGEAGGYTFSMAGEHKIQAVFRLSARRVLASNVETFTVCAAEVQPKQRRRYDALRRALATPAAARMLYYRGGEVHRAFEDHQRRFARRCSDAPSSADALYALGRTLARRRWSDNADPAAAKLRVRRGVEDLKRVAQHNLLSPRRKERARQLVSAYDSGGTEELFSLQRCPAGARAWV